MKKFEPEGDILPPGRRERGLVTLLESGLTRKIHPLPPELLRWHVSELESHCPSTADVEPADVVLGQPVAAEALRFALASKAPNHNVFIRGMSGSGRMSLVRSMLDTIKPPAADRHDYCYVHNFARPDRPRLIVLPAGQGRAFRQRMEQVAEFVREELAETLAAEPFRSRRSALESTIERRINKLTAPLEAELAEKNMALVRMRNGPASEILIFPTVMERPVPPEELPELVDKGQISQKFHDHFFKVRERYLTRLKKVDEQARDIWRKGLEQLNEFNRTATRRILQNLTETLPGDFPATGVDTFVEEVINDVLENRLDSSSSTTLDPARIYGVNLVSSPETTEGMPVVVETSPTVTNLVGMVDPQQLNQPAESGVYRGIQAGSLVRAAGGFLVLDARDVLSEPQAWKKLLKTLRTGQVEIAPPGDGNGTPMRSCKPDPIPIRVRIILVGDGELYGQLGAADPNFTDWFKVLADFDHELPRNRETLEIYTRVLARIVRQGELCPINPRGVATVMEHGARLASRAGYVTAQFGLLSDVVSEADFLARERGETEIGKQAVQDAADRIRQRAMLPHKRFLAGLADGRQRVLVKGRVVGQVNGLAVGTSGHMSYGIPIRLTGTVGPGPTGPINIEGESRLSGQLHTKGFHILGGLLRHLLRLDHPVPFNASVAFEQSYGGIDGDSASLAEACCLISALVEASLRQDLAVTGAIDQHGHVQVVGAINEKIEGFFDACQSVGLTGDQGVIIPRANAGDLMLRPDVVKVCRNNGFHVYAVDSFYQAMELLTGRATGVLIDGNYPDGSLLDRARKRARQYWQESRADRGDG